MRLSRRLVGLNGQGNVRCICQRIGFLTYGTPPVIYRVRGVCDCGTGAVTPCPTGWTALPLPAPCPIPPCHIQCCLHERRERFPRHAARLLEQYRLRQRTRSPAITHRIQLAGGSTASACSLPQAQLFARRFRKKLAVLRRLSIKG